MKGKLEQLYETTVELSSNLAESDQYDFEELIRLREEVLRQLQEQPDLTVAEREMLAFIDSRHSVLLNRMLEIRDEASLALDKIRHFRMQKNVYEPDYDRGSYFIDRKK